MSVFMVKRIFYFIHCWLLRLTLNSWIPDDLWPSSRTPGDQRAPIPIHIAISRAWQYAWHRGYSGAGNLFSTGAGSRPMGKHRKWYQHFYMAICILCHTNQNEFRSNAFKYKTYCEDLCIVSVSVLFSYLIFAIGKCPSMRAEWSVSSFIRIYIPLFYIAPFLALLL